MERIGHYPGTDANNNVVGFLERNSERFPGREVYKWVHPETLRSWNAEPGALLLHDSITMSAFNETVKHVAAGFAELGIRSGDTLILFVPMSIQLYIAMSALQRIGAIPVFLDSWARRKQLGVCARAVSPKGVISFELAFDSFRAAPELNSIPLQIAVGPTTRTFSASLEELAQGPGAAPVCPVQGEQTALVTFTTGSSGTPKGANRTHRFLCSQHYALDRLIPYADDDVDLPAFPIFSLNNLAAGVMTVIPAIDLAAPSERDPSVLVGQIESCGVTTATLSLPLLTGLAAFCTAQGLELTKLRRTVTGGAPISRDNLEAFKAIAPRSRIWVLYGSTEVEPIAHIEAQELLEVETPEASDPELVDEGVMVGRVDEGLAYRFIKVHKGPITISSKGLWQDLEVPAGEVGELIVSGAHVCADYYNDSGAFARAKIVDEIGTVWHRTGDLARMDANGFLWIVGRVHNAILRAGKYVFPVKAELALKKLPFLKQAAYLGIEDRSLGEKTVCVVCPDDFPSPENAENEKRWCREIRRIMAKNDIPVDQILFVRDIPMDPRHHSKVEYEVLRDRLQQEGLV